MLNYINKIYHKKQLNNNMYNFTILILGNTAHTLYSQKVNLYSAEIFVKPITSVATAYLNVPRQVPV